MQLEENIKYMIEIQENAVKKGEKEYQSLPAGNLKKRYKGDVAYYTHSVNGKERGITKQSDMVGKLARKRYLKVAVKLMQENLEAIKRLEKEYQNIGTSDIIAKLPVGYRDLPYELFFPREKDRWETQVYRTNPYKREHCTIATGNGVMVRSKSEQGIGNALELRDIPYRYEAEVLLNGKMKYPDFTIMRPSDGAVILWEHFGLLDDVQYAENMGAKLHMYIDNGWIPWKNLICTFEEDVRDTRKLCRIIDVLL